MARQFSLLYSQLASDDTLVFLLDMGSDSSKHLLANEIFSQGVRTGERHENSEVKNLHHDKPQEAKMEGTSPRQR